MKTTRIPRSLQHAVSCCQLVWDLGLHRAYRSCCSLGRLGRRTACAARTTPRRRRQVPRGTRCRPGYCCCLLACCRRAARSIVASLFATPAQAVLVSQSGPHPTSHATAWLSAIPSEAGSELPPDRMLLASRRRRLRLLVHVAPHRCGAHGHGCGAVVDAYSGPASMHGRASRMKLWDPKASWSCSGGLRARPPVTLTQPMADGIGCAGK